MMEQLPQSASKLAASSLGEGAFWPSPLLRYGTAGTGEDGLRRGKGSLREGAGIRREPND